MSALPEGLRARAGFVADLATLSRVDRPQAIDAITLVGDALAEGVPEVLGDWALEGHPGTFAFPLEEGGYVTASVEGEGAELLVWFERAGDSTILATPRR